MKRFLALSAVAGIALSACQASVTAPESIKIGLISPLTGDAAAIGADMANGVKLAVAEINADGGIGGKEVELVTEDGRCTGSDAAAAAQKLAGVDKVVAIIGGFCSGETLAASPIAEEAKIVLISPGSSSPAITDAGEYVFRDYPSDALKTKAMKTIFADKGWKKVAVISENTDFAVAFRDSLKKDLGAEAIVFDEMVEPGTKDFRTLMTRLKDAEFDVFFPNANADTIIAAMMNQYAEQGISQPSISHDVADSATLGELAKDAVEGMWVVNVPNAGEGTEFQTALEAAYGKPQSSIAFAAHSYDATMVLAEIMKEKGTDGTAMRDALLALPSHKGVIGDFHFDANGDVLGVPYALKQFKDGKTVEMEAVPVEQ